MKQNESRCNRSILDIERRLTEQHEISQSQKQLKIDELNEKILAVTKELQEKTKTYETRASRPEDVAKINEL